MHAGPYINPNREAATGRPAAGRGAPTSRRPAPRQGGRAAADARRGLAGAAVGPRSGQHRGPPSPVGGAAGHAALWSAQRAARTLAPLPRRRPPPPPKPPGRRAPPCCCCSRCCGAARWGFHRRANSPAGLAAVRPVSSNPRAAQNAPAAELWRAAHSQTAPALRGRMRHGGGARPGTGLGPPQVGPGGVPRIEGALLPIRAGRVRGRRRLGPRRSFRARQQYEPKPHPLAHPASAATPSNRSNRALPTPWRRNSARVRPPAAAARGG
jgi:hypothetical protein